MSIDLPTARCGLTHNHHLHLIPAGPYKTVVCDGKVPENG